MCRVMHFPKSVSVLRRPAKSKLIVISVDWARAQAFSPCAGSGTTGGRAVWHSVGFDADVIIHRVPEPLLAAEIPLSRLDAHVAE